MWDVINILVPPLAAAIIGFMLWFSFGRDPRANDPVVPRYQPPEDLTVLEAAVLMDDLLQSKDMAYELYDLYFKGIVEFEDNGYLKLLQPLSSPEVQALPGTQQAVLALLFKGNAVGLKLDSESTRFKAGQVKEEIYERLKLCGFYRNRPGDQRKFYYLVAYGLILGSIGFNVVYFIDRLFSKDGLFAVSAKAGAGKISLYLPLSLIAGLVLAGVVFGVFGRAMARKTAEGVKKYIELLGFKEFVMTAEKDRIEYFLQNDPQAYKKILPYAFLFGVQEKWLAPCEDLNRKFLDKDLQRLTFKMDLNAFEQVFEEKHNIVFSAFNIVFYALAQALKLGLSMVFGSMTRQTLGRRNSARLEEDLSAFAPMDDNAVESLQRLRDLHDEERKK